MTDKELIELAAKAAGYTLEERYTKQDEYWPWCEEVDSIWNPLWDDGDALRLAVKLGLVVNTGIASIVQGKMFTELDSAHLGDPYAATRRAIVRAAAEIGRSMK